MSSVLRSITVAAALAGATTPARADTERLEPGTTTRLPAKGALPHREDLLIATVGGGLSHGARGPGGEAFTSLRFAEALGLGVGVRASSEEAVGFLRMDAIGLAINHWTFLGYADLATSGDWSLGGAMLAPVRRDTYLRFSIDSTTDGEAAAGVGMEHDLW